MQKLNWFFVVFMAVLFCSYGVLDAVRDTLAHHYSVSVFSEWKSTFWDVNLSWCNKWKNCEAGKEAFPLSSSLLVFTTDAWHLMKFFQHRIIAFFPAYMVVGIFYMPNKGWKRHLLIFLGAFVAFSLVQAASFHLFYHFILLK